MMKQQFDIKIISERESKQCHRTLTGTYYNFITIIDMCKPINVYSLKFEHRVNWPIVGWHYAIDPYYKKNVDILDFVSDLSIFERFLLQISDKRNLYIIYLCDVF